LKELQSDFSKEISSAGDKSEQFDYNFRRVVESMTRAMENLKQAQNKSNHNLAKLSLRVTDENHVARDEP